MARKLKAQAGTDEANFGDQSYRVDNDGTVVVPDEAAASLVTVGGFTDITDEQPAGPEVDAAAAKAAAAEVAATPSTGVKMRAPANSSDPCWRGVPLPLDAEGNAFVPHAAVPDMIWHGFALLED